MGDAKELQDDVKKEVDRKTKECETANTLPADLNRPAEQGITKKSSDETKARPEASPGVAESTEQKPATGAAAEEYVSPSEPLGDPNKSKPGETKPSEEYVSPSLPLNEEPVKKV